MVKFHPINRVMTAGTILFFISLIVLAIGAIFHTNGTILADTFLYGGLAFVVSIVLIFLGVLLGARSGKLQTRAGNIWNNNKKKQ
jgi:sulfite exporter TauE/SafE